MALTVIGKNIGDTVCLRKSLYTYGSIGDQGDDFYPYQDVPAGAEGKIIKINNGIVTVHFDTYGERTFLYMDHC
ncbi:MAG: hypothetical protein J4428_00470 [Candidatus Aenigmarchaeota archaeon]|nr:hypothetical protein [Candidatus Aenigmarchaeota archaeon]